MEKQKSQQLQNEKDQLEDLLQQQCNIYKMLKHEA
jgi:hypothetical protein